MRKNHTIRLSDNQYRLMLVALGFAEGAFRSECQFEISDALLSLINKVKQAEPNPESAVIKIKAG